MPPARNLILPLPTDRRGRRLTQLFGGLLLYGFSTALMVEAHLGLNPWDVLHQGLARRTGATIGSCTILAGIVVLLLWIPLRQRPGLGTISNALVIGVAVDASLALLPDVSDPGGRWALLFSGVILNGFATGMYIGAALGPGPRDGLMTGLAARGLSVRLVRTAIEITVLLLGLLLRGTAGWGTLVYAAAIGPLAHRTIPLLSMSDAHAAIPEDAHSSVP